MGKHFERVAPTPGATCSSNNPRALISGMTHSKAIGKELFLKNHMIPHGFHERNEEKRWGISKNGALGPFAKEIFYDFFF
jgi:hypothetical protein